MIPKILSRTPPPINLCTDKEAQALLKNARIQHEFVDGKSADAVYRVDFSAEFCESHIGRKLGLVAEKTYVLKRSPETDCSETRLVGEIRARQELEKSPYKALYTPILASHTSDAPDKTPHFLLMEEVRGQTVSEWFLTRSSLTEDAPFETVIAPYCDQLAQAYLNSPP